MNVPSLFFPTNNIVQFLYLNFMHPLIGPRVGFMWTIVVGRDIPNYALARTAFTVPLKKFPEHAVRWLWGSQVR